MKLYCHPASITSRPVRLYIAEKGLKVQEEIVDLFTGAHHSPEYIAINPSRLVPVLEDGDFRLTEHGAIGRILRKDPRQKMVCNMHILLIDGRK